VSFAVKTTVQSEKSRAEIESLVRRHAGRDAEFSYGRAAGVEAVQFVAPPVGEESSS
jgi:hypothetical protein